MNDSPGSIAYFLFVLDGSAAYSFFDPTETSASKVKKTFVSKFAPKINTSDVIEITGLTLLQENTGLIFTGQATQFQDMIGI